MDDRQAALAAADARREAAREAERLRAAESALDLELTQATALHAAAQSALSQLRQRRTDGMAGELASTLRQEHPCPVCGSLDHPAPATHSDPVSLEDIALAEEARDAAAQKERQLASTSATLRAESAAATARADGRDIEQAESEYADAAAALSISRAAVEDLTALDIQLGELVARAERLDAEREEDARALRKHENSTLCCGSGALRRTS